MLAVAWVLAVFYLYGSLHHTRLAWAVFVLPVVIGLVGLAFGWLAVIAIPESIINQLAIPTLTLVIYVVVATVAGLLAAYFPARRAARLNILDAIAHE